MKLTRNLKTRVLLPTVLCLLSPPQVSAEPQSGTAVLEDHRAPTTPDTTPRERRDAAVKLARRGEYLPAINLLEKLLTEYPDNKAAYHDLLVILGWAEQDQKAVLLAGDLDSAIAPVEVLESLGKSSRNIGDFTQSLRWYELAISRNPEHREALRGKILALQQLRLPAQALVVANTNPQVLTGHELVQLKADWVAVQIRWTNQTVSDKMQTDAALNGVLHPIMATGERVADPDAVQRRADFDYIVALQLQQRMTEAVFEFEQLAATSEQIPAYVLAAVAAAYLHLRLPENAQELVLRALEQEPDNFALQQLQFYVYVDLEQHQAAMALAETLRQSEAVWLQVPGSRVVKSNPRRMQAEIIAGLSLSFADQLPQAQQRFENMLTQAPHNTDLRHELATVYRRRGWVERAQFEYQQVMSIEPKLTAAAVGHAHTLLDQRDYALADRSIKSLLEARHYRQDVVRLKQRWRQIQQHEYRIDSSAGKSSGSQFGSEQYTIDGIFFARPLAYRWRPFIHSTDAFAEFPEGDTARRRLGAGVEYRSVKWVGSLEIDNDRNGGGDPGVQGQAKWIASDAWSIGAVWETQSDAIPLRGHRIGLHADRIGFNAAYRASESQQLSMSGDKTEISDGNTRYGWSLQGRQRIVTRPAYKFDLGAEFSTSRANSQDVVYFNPRHATSLRLNALNDWRTYRRYDFAFTQQLNLGFGYFWQDSRGSSPVASLEYLANIDVNAGLRLHVGIRYAHDVYDGDTENATFLIAGIAGTF